MRFFLAGSGMAFGVAVTGLAVASLVSPLPVADQAVADQAGAVPHNDAPAAAPDRDTTLASEPAPAPALAALPDADAPTAPAAVATTPESETAIVQEPAFAPEPVPVAPRVVDQAPAQLPLPASAGNVPVIAAAPDMPVIAPQIAPQIALVLPPPPASQDIAVVTIPAADPQPVADDAPRAPVSQANPVRVNRPGALAVPVDPALADLAPEPALLRYAVDVDYAADLPLVAVVLLDDPALRDGPAAIAALPFVPTIVLDAGSPDVTARMRAYRAAGVEVAVFARLPQGAQPADVETTYLAALGLVPQAVALFSDGTGPESGPGFVADQVTRLIRAEERGYIVVPRGLGAVARNTGAGDIPRATVTRTIDGADETPAMIARALDQSAFRARQTGTTVLLGRVAPDTIAALQDWGTSTDPAELSLVPVSAILKDQLPPP